MVVFGQSGFFREKVVVFEQNGCIRERWFYSGKLIVFGQSGCIQAMWLYSGKMVVFGQKKLYSGMSCCIRAKWL